MDQRTQTRVVADRELACRYRGAKRPIFLYNLSSDGCMALLEDDAGPGDDRITIVLSGRREASGRVVWRHGAFVGIAFARKLDRQTIALLDVVRPCRAG